MKYLIVLHLRVNIVRAFVFTMAKHSAFVGERKHE